ncbi:MAG TPA: ABC transporter permease [Acidobacteriaceae bacterium]|nr:ABC transporter permease [Acidobacteriaceae bacterium]
MPVLSVMRDIKLAFRLLWRSPGLTGIALVSIALSVGATAVVFAAVKSVLINPFPYARPGELVQIRTEFPRFGPSHSDWALWNDAEEIMRRTRTLASAGIYRNEILNLSADGSAPPEALYGLRASASLFATLGVTPMLGHNILPGEDQPGHANEMILSYGLWARRFHSDPGIVGRTITIDGHDCLVIGVMPQGFNFPLRRGAVHTPSPYVEFWAPLRSGRAVSATEAVGVVARLRPGVSLPEAQQDLASISSDLSREFPATNRDHTLRMGFLRDRTVGNAEKALFFLMAAAGMFLLIGCANVANLLLARGFSRQREIAIRVAIGAGQGRIVRQLLTESCVLAGLGGVGGYLLTVLAWRLLPAVAPVSIPRLAAARADWQVFAFALTIALLNGVLFGMMPALRLCRTNASSAQDLRVHSGIAVGRDRIRSALVTIEVALAVSLVVIGGQLLASFVGLLRTDPGFDAKRVLASVIIPAGDRYHTPEQHGLLFRRILDAVRVLPGVESVGTIDALPFSGENHGGLIGGGGLETAAEVDVVSAGYLQTMGVRLIDGRWFGDEDMNESADSVIVNNIAASHLWPETSALGKRICVDCSPEKPNNWKRVVGVVSGIRHAAMDEPEGASAYLASGALENAAFLVVRSDRPTAEMERAIRQSIAQVDPNQPVFLSASMEALIGDSLADRRFIMDLLAVTGCLALAMAAAGVYGVATYATSRRTQEIGVRMALGATRTDVEALIFRQGFVSAAVGLVIGLGSTLVFMRAVGGVLPGLHYGNFGQVGIEVGFVCLIAAIACWLPARRAAKIDPMLALRQE